MKKYFICFAIIFILLILMLMNKAVIAMENTEDLNFNIITKDEKSNPIENTKITYWLVKRNVKNGYRTWKIPAVVYQIFGIKDQELYGWSEMVETYKDGTAQITVSESDMLKIKDTYLLPIRITAPSGCISSNSWKVLVFNYDKDENTWKRVMDYTPEKNTMTVATELMQ